LLGMIAMAISGSGWGQKAVNRADILLAPGWQQIYDAHVPDAGLIRELKLALAGLRAVVYFGTWCDDSKNNVPLLLKILDSLNVAEFKVDFFEVEKKSVPGQVYYVEELLVQKVPTFIFYRGDYEIGRIIENPKDSILQDMLQIIL
jgi:hypothetical protein